MSPRAGLDRSRVVEAAVAIADADGLEAITIARVAAELGVKGPSLYNHVAGRDALVREVALLGVTELNDAMAIAAAGRSGTDALLAVGRAYRAYASAAPGRYAAALRAPAEDDSQLNAAAARALELMVAVLRGFPVAEDATAQVHAVRMLRATVHGFVALEAGGGFAMSVPVDQSFDAALEMLAAGFRAPDAAPGAARP